MTRWTEVSQTPSLWRFKSLSEELNSCGFKNEFEATSVASDAELPAAISEAETKFSQLRIGAEFAEKSIEHFPNLPSELLNLRCADAFVPEHGQWWPRCFYFDGVMRMLVRDLKNLDLTGGVFIMGATWEARVITSALARAGFNKITISDHDEARAERELKFLQRSTFGVNFQYVQKAMVTQLAGTNSIGVNVLSLVEYPELVEELSYLNFLRPDGVWIETQPDNSDSPITAEALSLGTQVEPALHLLSNVDAAWAEKCFNVQIDLSRYREQLRRSFSTR